MIKIIMTVLLFLVAGVSYLLYFEMVAEPDLPGVLVKIETEWDGYTRNYSYYAPSSPAEKPALVLVGHGSGGNTAQSRSAFGYAFEALAERYGFYVVYPEGYQNHYNGCRKAGPYEANTLKIDDVGFTRSIVSNFTLEKGINPGAVFATGISNGGQYALRLALEAPDLVAAVAPVVTSLPSENNMDCIATGKAVNFLLMNGTDDPMNPYNGGTVALYGIFGDRGTVLSSADTVAYWANLAGHTAAPTTITLADNNPDDNSSVEVQLWEAEGRKNVALYTVVGGGHSAPHPAIRLPRLLGGSNRDIVAAEVIWDFFQQSR